MIEHLTTESFKQKVKGFNSTSDWKLEGEKPIIVDFYATWCNPCKAIAPILEEIKNEYGDKIDIYKVDVDDETELSSVFNIKGVPTIAFIPVGKAPIIKVGAMPKSAFIKMIDDNF